MLFMDLKNFSSISELLSAMTAEVTRDHGIVNKFIEDGIVAVFGVPVARNSPKEIRADVQRAVACGLIRAGQSVIFPNLKCCCAAAAQSWLAV
ncbi:MAG: hypothetical protein AB4352_15555 [Hormoscilla sp.]